MKRKSFILLVLLLIVPLFVFATGKQEKEEGPRDVTITIWTKAGDTELWRGQAAVEAAIELNKECNTTSASEFPFNPLSPSILTPPKYKSLFSCT